MSRTGVWGVAFEVDCPACLWVDGPFATEEQAWQHAGTHDDSYHQGDLVTQIRASAAADASLMFADLTFAEVSAVNRARCRRWHKGFPVDGWTGADWSNAVAGEAGEACNVVKKLRRAECGIAQAAGVSRDELVAALAVEIGDTFLYLDLLAQHYGLDLAACVVGTFNRVSAREGFPERLMGLAAPGSGTRLLASPDPAEVAR
jgi:hypothetical protein